MSFFKSEIMRSYYRTAKNKGWVKDDPEIVRTASEKSLKATGNLLVDLCALATALRKKGYESQANDLENKISAYKKAETHLYRVHDEDGPDVLEFAHPDGDFTISDSECGYGDVETELSSHKKIIDIINKQPTGKKASLKKSAQALGFQENIKALINSLKADQFDSSGNKVMKYHPHELIQAFESGSGYEKYISYFKKIAPGIANQIQGYIKKRNAVYGGNTESSVVIAQKLMQLNDPQQLIKYGRVVDPSRSFDKYFIGSQPGAYKSSKEMIDLFDKYKNHPLSPDNPESIWKLDWTTGDWSKDKNKLQNVAQEMHEYMQKVKKRAFIGLNGINENIKNSLISYVGQLQKLMANPRYGINNAQKELAPFMEGGRIYNYLVPLLESLTGSSAEYKGAIKRLTSSISSTKQNVQGQAQVTATRFSKASALFDEYSDANPSAEGFDKNAEISAKLSSLVKYYSMDFATLASKLKEITNKDFETFNEVDRFSIDWLNTARKLTGKHTADQAVKFEDLPEA